MLNSRSLLLVLLLLLLLCCLRPISQLRASKQGNVVPTFARTLVRKERKSVKKRACEAQGPASCAKTCPRQLISPMPTFAITFR